MSIKETAFGDLPRELATTRKALEAVPDDKLTWSPHEKSFTLGHLASHIANLVEWGVMILNTDSLDLSEPFPERPEPTSTAQILAEFDEKSAAWMAAMDQADDETMTGIWELRMGDEVLTAFPRAANLRSFVASHMIHHRAQLGVYLRLLNVPVPATYGPSADENPFG
jgi:uncharacterized damage-inducible protein DinB